MTSIDLNPCFLSRMSPRQAPFLLTALILLAAALLTTASALRAAPVSTEMTFQGSLLDAGVPADGTYDLAFQLWDGATSGSGVPLGGQLSEDDVGVVDGVFTVYLDFGIAAFDAEARWIEVMVRDGASMGAFTPLSPFVPVTPSPQAQWAENAGLLEGMQASDFAASGHSHAALSTGTGLNGGPYDGSTGASFAVDFGASPGRVAEGNQTVTITAGTGLNGGVAGDAIGDGVAATLDVNFGTSSDSAAPGDAAISILPGSGLAGGVSNDVIGDGVSASLSVMPGPGINSDSSGVSARVDNVTIGLNGSQQLELLPSVIGEGLVNENAGFGDLVIGVETGDGIDISGNDVVAKVDGTTIGFNGSGELTSLAGGVTPAKVVVVALAGGNYTSPVDAMNDRLNWCGTASAANPCLIKIMPGVYNLGGALTLRSYIDVQGSGPGITVLTRTSTGISSGVVRAVSECASQRCELRDLSIEDGGSGNSIIGLYVTSGSAPRVTNVHFDLSSHTLDAWAVHVANSGVTLKECEIRAVSQAARGISAIDGDIRIEGCEVRANGSAQSQALYLTSGSSAATRNSEFYAQGSAPNSRSAFLDSSSLSDLDSAFHGGPGSSQGAGIFAQASSAGGYNLRLTGSRVLATSPLAADNLAIYGQNYTITLKDAYVQSVSGSGSNDAIEVFRSSVYVDDCDIIASDRPLATIGSTGGPYQIRISDSFLQSSNGLATVGGSNAHFVNVFHSRLSGGAASSFANCRSVLDENYTYFETTCP